MPVMMLGSKKEGVLSMPFRSGQKFASPFCLFSKVQSACPPPGNTPVYLNVYDLTPVNGYVFWVGVGIFHSGIEVHGVEYAFGAHDYSISGVFEVEPRQCPGFKFRKSIFMGTTYLDPLQIRAFMEIQSVNYNGDTYHLISAVCNCILPESLKITAVRHDPDCQAEDSEKKRLTSAWSCFSSISLCQSSTSSLKRDFVG